MKKLLYTSLFIAALISPKVKAQYQPKNASKEDVKKAQQWVDKTYKNLSQDEKLGQLFIVALYTNRGEEYISQVRNIVTNDKIGGLILMQDDAAREINLVNEFQQKSKVPLMIGMDAEWGIYQRIATAHKFPWAMTLGAIQDKNLVYQMAAKIAEDCHRMGINWDFAPVVDVNTNPNNPIIGNRSFGSEVNNVISSALSYSNGLQDHNILAAIKHFPGHGDTSTDSHLDLPVVSHTTERLDAVELAPFKALMNKGIGGVMVAHLYVPSLESGKGIPASVSKNIITGLLKEKLGYKGLIITDALNMAAVANKYQPGELDAMAFKAGNDIMLFSQGVSEGKKLIQKAIDKGEISQSRVEESVKKILLTKYFLGLTQYTPKNPENINKDLNNDSHIQLVQNLYSNALTLLKDEKKLLPLTGKQTYYVPLEEAPYQTFANRLGNNVIIKKAGEINTIPAGSTVIVGFHKDNSTAYKPYKISAESKKVLSDLTKNQNVILNVFGSAYALKDIDISKVSTVLVSYENNDDSMNATADALNGKTKIWGKLPVLVNDQLKPGMGIDLNVTTSTKTK
ncbi:MULTISPECIES: glycoside hydrolase family 3 N-terminal domain-containing protein [unclassified Chryseobacterium]|uniref:glycoside hydrolase family 3 protein n=1 Tax=unclassified Chryseobacterium TaxID=2593645 RepID=UPI001C118596|nr:MULTISPECIES: glycoside hydrolase family 3 N-terminal domain-containing protein [unclassified Chryseobacterium]QWT84272.1 glycoside hydrolase family 3 protein [Chryseobacterium sp. PCH239]WFB66595.1 glycoside hydrolase family 3 N-terminal domain-containing protein [Chryseobacterium sp. WX]WNI35846.1 glycoside hydrolase family 3 N-terminal domain-containing protein [Chryseobacterium sp. SG20098]